MSKKIRFAGRQITLPSSQWVRIGLGLLFIGLGLMGFLPVVGFWMIPVGLLILSIDIPIVRRWRRQVTVWWHGKREERAARKAAASRSEPG